MYVLHRSQPAAIFIITPSPLTISAFTIDYLTYPRTLFAAAAHITRPDPGPYTLIADIGQPLTPSDRSSTSNIRSHLDYSNVHKRPHN